MSTAPFYKTMSRLGYKLVGTGGGCDAWELGNTDNHYIWITKESNIPESRLDTVIVGFYHQDTMTGYLECEFRDILDKKIKLVISK